MRVINISGSACAIARPARPDIPRLQLRFHHTRTCTGPGLAIQQSRNKSSCVAAPTTTAIFKERKAATSKSNKVSPRPIGFVCMCTHGRGHGCGCFKFSSGRCWGGESHTEEDRAQWKKEGELKRQHHNYRVDPEQTMAHLAV